MSCVVCDRPVDAGAEHYANAWERTRKRYPCCSAECSQRFDPDVHWLPAVFPPPAQYAEEQRMLGVSRTRIFDGDSPTVVVREMLLAGVNPVGLRKILTDASIAGARTRDTTRKLGIIGAIGGLLTGSWKLHANNDKRDPSALDGALADLERWNARIAKR